MTRSCKRSFGTLALERLEQRCLLAGNVTAAVAHGNLIVTGDAESNDIQIFQTAEGIQVLGLPDTTVNSGASFTATGVTKDVEVSLCDGNDTVALDVTVPRDLGISLGAGDDAVFFGGFFEPPPGGTGTNKVIVGRDLDLGAGDGADGVFIFESEVGRKSDVNLGAGDDFMLSFLTTFGGKTEITGGDGADSINLESATFADKTEINTGAGDDTLFLLASTFQDKTMLNGGNGFDTLTNDGNTFAVAPEITSFEA